jgi:NAD(P)-dependent dehydrogenase (short-subunit alcohol dehydrogenase family)
MAPPSDEVALVTGAAGALGSEVARVLSSRGHAVALVDSEAHAERLQRLAGTLARSSYATGDLADATAWSRVVASTERDLGRAPTMAALVAGAWRGGQPLHELTSDDTWRAMLSANTETVYRGLRALLPAMVAGKRGSVVVIGSRAAEQPASSARAAAYAASKSAAVALAQAAAAEVLDHGVRINAVLPSTLDTPANRAAMPNADVTRWVSLGSAAGVIAFLLSDDARDISGAAIPLYGRA